MKQWELTKSIIPQPEDKKFDNQVVLHKKWRGFLNPIEENKRLVGPYREKKPKNL